MNHVLSGLAANPALPSELVDRLIAVADADLAIDLASREDLSHAQAVALLARDERSGVRLAREGRLTAADVDPNATAPVLLFCLADDRARPVAAAHPALPPRVIVELLSDPDRQVAEAAAGNPSLPSAVMTRLVTGIEEPFTNAG
ncbi:hypothetical protein ACFYW9_31385 [Streptomyces sp. NPDC002698]|uniref:hypothetical protein n=1 Tax=Streptomyces sp. NPDC002698 TaxID=3364660 RepID=UPI0036B4A93A